LEVDLGSKNKGIVSKACKFKPYYMLALEVELQCTGNYSYKPHESSSLF